MSHDTATSVYLGSTARRVRSAVLSADGALLRALSCECPVQDLNILVRVTTFALDGLVLTQASRSLATCCHPFYLTVLGCASNSSPPLRRTVRVDLSQTAIPDLAVLAGSHVRCVSVYLNILCDKHVYGTALRLRRQSSCPPLLGPRVHPCFRVSFRMSTSLVSLRDMPHVLTARQLTAGVGTGARTLVGTSMGARRMFTGTLPVS
ncbi:hypothetical protein K466DRAFT_186174 [Polyporus arcularius HHB13444]|uniref:Uncharacterized protein n=1 Tax=Polyporus arcularius HHB13444 TaxID=1314778 RepID=A0A5C3P753_9APHY|nr:hypothetical protein K466DRAFT_186174 [Polyporus arcularius HHB13444]